MADNCCPGDFNANHMQQYFNTLPKYVQENIKQSSVQPQNLQELQQCADNLMRRS